MIYVAQYNHGWGEKSDPLVASYDKATIEEWTETQENRVELEIVEVEVI